MHVLRDERDAHREPNIIRYSTQGTQHNTYVYIMRARARSTTGNPSKKAANIILSTDYLVASKAMVGLPVGYPTELK